MNKTSILFACRNCNENNGCNCDMKKTMVAYNKGKLFLNSLEMDEYTIEKIMNRFISDTK